ncbi:hypothetical protein DL240_12505 [Lujinxingia litoralis]|uniref:Uncharacterized protein n=1 Tax=Lujinxingia litoralis TaxID=2211119 RepID=A0A328C9M7_9DELT|nr:hypothetical protein [Lujinxingia litoralis]RAL21670.1 hypothetical protein DL240_12505 [Lujinxingia litoralis]
MSNPRARGLLQAACLSILLTGAACAHKPSPGELYLADAEAALNSERLEEAQALAQLAIDEPDTPEREALTLLAQTYRAQSLRAHAAGQLEEAIAFLRQAASLEPATAQRRSDLDQALALATETDLPAARLEPLLLDALALNPNLPELHRRAARTYEELGRHEDARAHYLWLWTASPGDLQAGLRLGVLLLMEERHREAHTYLANLYEAHPDDLQIGLNLSEALEGLGRTSRTHELFETMLEAHGEQPGLLFRYAAYLERQGHSEEARRMQARARDAMPSIEQRDDLRPLR